MAAWTRDLFEGRHPTFTPDQATVVEHRPSGTIVSSVLLVSQIWSFAGIGVRVGQPELVGTHVDYRGRGLVRAQFEVIHRWSAFPGLSFLQLLFGFRSLEELEAAFPDCLVRTHEVRALLTALFPKQASDVWALA